MNSRSRDLDPLAIAQLTLDTAPYLSCDDCFEQVDAHVDALLSGAAEILTPDFRAHLIGCAACRDEAHCATQARNAAQPAHPERLGWTHSTAD